MKTIKQKLFLVKLGDFKGLLMVIIAFIPALILKLKQPNIWLLCERHDEARDNGYAFFEYLMTEPVAIKSYYAIDFSSSDYEKVAKYEGNIIKFGSLRHYIYWLACKANVSSVKNSGPNNLIGFLFRKFGLMNQKQVFLQHGITKDDAAWLHYSDTKFGLFCTGAKPEDEFVKQKFGYPVGNVVYTGGMTRYDWFTENRDETTKPFILIMPTWRKWLKPGDPDFMRLEGTTEFEQTEYYKHWNGLINSELFISLLEEKKVKAVFYPHPTMQNYVNDFHSESELIEVADINYDLPTLIANAKMLITDYSSVYFDFVYQEKPIISYGFDLAKFRQNHYEKGYIGYEDNPFLDLVESESELINKVDSLINSSYQVSKTFETKVAEFFPTRDNHNRKRAYRAILEKLGN